MIASSLILDAVVVAVALGAPWWLTFDHFGLRRAAGRRGVGRSLYLSLATLCSVVFAMGCVALVALGAGALLALDGLSAAEALLPLWLPLLVASALAGLRRYTPVVA